MLLAARAQRIAVDRRGPVVGVALVIAILGAAVLGYVAWNGQVETRAGALLAEALSVNEAQVGPPPAADTPAPTGLSFATERERHEAAREKFKAVADQYPSTEAGVFARYQEAVALIALGSPNDAVTAFQETVDRAGEGFYGEMARLGLADALARSGEYDRAIQGFREFAERENTTLPIDGILMRLGQTYREAGQTDEAKQTFTRLVDEFPMSPFTGDARRELEQLDQM